MTIYLNENIKRLRLEKGLTQETLSDFLGVTSQSVSNWERGESYPDITMLPKIASFFKITIDDLMGVNKSEAEKELLEKLEEYNNLTDGGLKQEILKDLRKKYPNDFRVLINQLYYLVGYSENKTEIFGEVHSIYNNIQSNCTNDSIRIKAKRAIIDYYRELSENENSGITFTECKKIIDEMPNMSDCKEMFCFYGKENDALQEIKKTLEEQLLLLNKFFSHYFYYDGFLYERGFSDEWIVSAIKAEIDFLNFVYDDGHYGKMWQPIIYNYGHLGLRYLRLGDTANALKSFRKMCELAIEFDNMDRITTMNSVMLKGKEFDKHILGTHYIAKTHIKYLLTEKYPLSDEFKKSNEFRELITIIER